MANIKRIVMLLLLCSSVCFYAYGQKPVILPKQSPVLPLDDNGFRKILPEDVADYINGTDSPLVVKFKPLSVDCSMLGPQTIQVQVKTNGASRGDGDLGGVGFPGYISGIAYDTKGNLYVNELRSYSVRKITPEGEVSVLAGSGFNGGSDGPGATARFGGLWGIVTDKQDNVYVADIDNNSIRKITPDGTVSTFAGTGFEGNANGPGNKASFSFPHNLDIDADGNIYVADFNNGMIRKITPEAVVSTFAYTYGKPFAVAAGPDGYVYWSLQIENSQDTHVSGVFRAKAGGQPEVYAGSNVYAYKDGPRLEAQFYWIPSMKFGANGNLFMVEYQGIRQLSPDGIVSTFYQTSDLNLNLTVDACQNLVVAQDYAIKRITMSKQVSLVAAGNYPKLSGNVPPSICQIADATIPVMVQSKPALPFIGDKVVAGCAVLADYTAQVFATDICPGTTITYTQSPAPGTPFANNNSIDVTITATDNTGGTDTKTFKVTNTGAAASSPTVAITALNNPVCEGGQASFHALVTNADAGTTYQWQVNGLNAGNNSADFASSILKNNDLVNCIVTTGGGCGVQNPAGGVTVSVTAKPVITLKAEEQILAGESITLSPVVTGSISSYKWEPATGLSDANVQSPVASPETTTSYKLTVTTIEGCQQDAPVNVTVVNQLNIPNTFTPNADGNNDTWAIKHLNGYANCTVKVYNRNGSPVFNSRGYTSAWTGTSGGKALPAGVYYYLINLGDGSAPLSGFVTIVR